MVCTICGKLSHFCIGRAQCIQCAVMQHMTAVGCRHVRPTQTNTRLVNLPIEPSVSYPVGSVTKKWLFCQQNLPFAEDVSYCLSWLPVFVCALVQSKVPFSDPPVSFRTLCFDHQTLPDWSQFCCKSMSDFILSCSLQFIYGGCWGGGMADLWK